MRIKSFRFSNVDGLGLVEVNGLSDTVVLAGPNGVGKTRVMRQLINFFRNPNSNQHVRLIAEATVAEEQTRWGKRELDTSNPQDASHLRATLQRNQRRNKYQSTVLNFDSDRAIAQVSAFGFSWDIADPHEEEVGWDMSYGYLRDRFTDVQHSLFRLVESQRRKISQDAFEKMKNGHKTLDLDYPDPIMPYREAFSRLLAPKKLLDLDVRAQKIYYEQDGAKFPLSALSSGEREVVNIVFDFILRNPSDCVILFDEPELHLHPELSYKLLQTLTSIGKNNQFIFCTHSAEIITASIENSVVFLTPKTQVDRNQAILVTRDDETHHALNLLGQSVGIISLGKKLLLIEGDEASLDKQTYGAILRSEFPEFVLVPVGGKGGIKSFEEVRRSILNKTIWGVEFFMLADKDAVHQHGIESVNSALSERFKLLPRYHIENYFLDHRVLAAVFSEMEAGGSWLVDSAGIKLKIDEFARQAIPLAVALKISAIVRESVGNVDVRPKGVSHSTTIAELMDKVAGRLEAEKQRIVTHLDVSGVLQSAQAEFTRLNELGIEASTNWHADVPGRVVFNRFASAAGMKPGRLKTLYLRHARNAEHDLFADIRSLFAEFRSAR